MKTETILELADKATENTSDNASDQFCLAFAELIIRECRPWLADDAFQEIKNHFGLD